MKAFFESEERRLELRAVASGWIGTPFRAHCRRKGLGVDCVNLAAAIYMECGLLREFNPPRYTMDHALHSEESLVTPWVEASGRFKPASDVRPGDLLVFKIHRTTHHVGVAVGPAHFVGVMWSHFVAECSLADSTWAKRLELVYRPIEEEHVRRD